MNKGFAMDSYDYVIVGAGSAGAVITHRLSAVPELRVALIEAGGEARRKEVQIPAAWAKLLQTDCDWQYATEPIASLGGRSIYLPRGKMLGGCSSINAMMYARGLRADFDEWAALGNPGWSYEEVLPYFRRSEGNGRGASEWHGGDGPLSVTDLLRLAAGGRRPQSDEPRLRRSLRRGGYCAQRRLQRRPAGRRRPGAAHRPARPALQHRRGVPDVRGAVAAQPRRGDERPGDEDHDRGRARAVEVMREGGVEAIAADREIVLSAGTFNSPQLLMLSGIGPADELLRHGLEVVRDLPGLGQNYQDHYTAKILVRSKTASILAAESLASLARLFFLRHGMLTSGTLEAAAFVRSDPGLEAPELEIMFLPVQFLDEGLTAPTEHGYTIAPEFLRPNSGGTVTLRSPDLLAPPVIRHEFLDNDEDVRILVDGLRLARRIAAADAFAPHRLEEIDPGPEVESDEALADHARSGGQTVYHPAGTCKMGSDEMAVVDPELRVHGIEGLRVADASIMPVVPRGHTNAAAIMIGEKASDLLLAAD